MGLKDQLLFVREKHCYLPFGYVKYGIPLSYIDLGYKHQLEVIDTIVEDVVSGKVAFDTDGDLVYLDGTVNTAKNPLRAHALNQYLVAVIGLHQLQDKGDVEMVEIFRQKMMKIRNAHEVNP